jgi:hypothetical protein
LFEPLQENSVKPSEKRVVGRISNSELPVQIAVMRAKVAGCRQGHKLENPTLNNRARRMQSRVRDVRVELADEIAESPDDGFDPVLAFGRIHSLKI